MKIDLTGRSALVTGSTAGIGLAIARGLAGAGAEVTINGRNAESVESALSALRSEVPRASFTGFAGDLSDAAIAAKLTREHPRFDVLVNNLGIYGAKDFFDIPDSEWTRYFEVNVMSGVRLARAYAPTMIERGWGRIVFVSSESALNIPVEMIHYGFTKTAQLSVSRGLAKRLAGTGVTVNSVLPGPTLTEGVAEMLKDAMAKKGQTADAAASEFVKAKRPSSIIRRAASVTEVANMVVYVCSPQASATTGAALRVEGGVVDTIA